MPQADKFMNLDEPSQCKGYPFTECQTIVKNDHHNFKPALSVTEWWIFVSTVGAVGEATGWIIKAKMRSRSLRFDSHATSLLALLLPLSCFHHAVMIAVHVLFSSEAADTHAHKHVYTCTHTEREGLSLQGWWVSSLHHPTLFTSPSPSVGLSVSLSACLSVLPTMRVSAFARQTAQPLPFNIYMNTCLKSTVEYRKHINVQEIIAAIQENFFYYYYSLPSGHCFCTVLVNQTVVRVVVATCWDISFLCQFSYGSHCCSRQTLQRGGFFTATEHHIDKTFHELTIQCIINVSNSAAMLVYLKICLIKSWEMFKHGAE